MTKCVFCSSEIELLSESFVVLNKYGTNTEMVICSCCFSFCPKFKTITDEGKECHRQAMFHENLWSHDSACKYSQALEIARIIDDYGEFFNPHKGKLICDIGSGRGNLLKALLDEGFNALGCEPSLVLFNKAIRLYGLNNSQLFNCDAISFVQNLLESNLRPSLFLFWHTIEHIPFSFKIIKNLLDVSEKNVTFIFQTPLLVSEHIYDEHLFFPTAETYHWLSNKLDLEIQYLEEDSSYAFLTCIMSKLDTRERDVSPIDRKKQIKIKGKPMESNLRMLGLTEEITESLISEINTGNIILVIPADYAQNFDFTKLNLSSNARVIDFRDKSGVKGISFIRGKHPRLDQTWPQYSHCNTGLARNIIISDVVQPDCKVETWQSEPHSVQPAPYGQPLSCEEYKHLHNHYQNLLVETFNFSPDVNSVSIWGDSAALVPDAKSWGGFFSARSWPLRWDGVVPSTIRNYEDKDFDAALVGIEIDVLNNGKPWCSNSGILAKIGLQIVGFQNENTAAIEIRSEDSDDPNKDSSTRIGCWHWGIIMRNSLSVNSTVLYSENQTIYRGIDFSKTSFTDGAVVIQGGPEKSGIVFTNGAEIFSTDNEDGGYLTLKAGTKGIRIISADGQKVLFELANESSASALGAEMTQKKHGHQESSSITQRLFAKKHEYLQTLSVCHIPKCMGSWLRKELLSGLGPERLFKPVATFVGNDLDWNVLDHVKSTGVDNFSMIEGHFIMSSVFADIMTGCYCITSIRNPIDRLRSQFNYVNASIGRNEIPDYTSINSFVKDNMVFFDNTLTRYLAGIDTPIFFDKVTGPDAVLIACNNIETKFDFIFIDKYLNACCDLFYELTNMLISSNEIINKSNSYNWFLRKEIFNNAIKDSKLYEFVKYDLTVYEFAISKFKRQAKESLTLFL